MIAVAIAACDSGQKAFHFDEMTYTPSETVFKLFAPADAQCFVVVGADTLRMEQTADTIWTVTAQGDRKGETYQFLVDGQASPGVFAKAVSVNGEKGVVVDMRDTDPEGWANDRPVRHQPQDIVVYEMHHRDFSVNQPLAQNPGKFLALTEPWAIDHLKELGINAVHILPSYDFGSVDETRIDPDLYYENAYEELPEGVIPARPDFSPQYNWGYDPVNYNVPEGGYSTDPFDPLCRIREFKQMVQALHQAGIAVVLDVVYNHTYDIEHSNFQHTYPDYYYRKNADGSYSNGSGCGNETASEKPMMRLFMIESVKHWINEYHIDGFRFDLMGCHDIMTMNEIRKAVDEIDPNIFIYGEGWSAGACALPQEQLGMKANIAQMPRIAAFSDEIRDALRGPFSDDTKPGWLAASLLSEGLGEAKESLKYGIVGAIEHPQVNQSLVNYAKKPWASEPTQMMSYVSCHDDMCLVDRLKASIPDLSEEALIRLDLLAQTAVFTSQGVPFMLSGEELLRTKQGVHNSFESPDSINRLDWQNKELYPQVFHYYKNLIALRKNHPAFRLGEAQLVREHLEFLPTDDGVVAFILKNHAGGDAWDNIIVVLNASGSAVAVDIPKGTYTVVCCDGQIDEKGLGEVNSNSVLVDPQSALIMHN